MIRSKKTLLGCSFHAHAITYSILYFQLGNCEQFTDAIIKRIHKKPLLADNAPMMAVLTDTSHELEGFEHIIHIVDKGTRKQT